MGVQLNLPDDLAERLEAEAQAGGCSLEQLILQRLAPAPAHDPPDPDELFAELDEMHEEMRREGHEDLTVEEIVGWIREGRESRGERM